MLSIPNEEQARLYKGHACPLSSVELHAHQQSASLVSRALYAEKESLWF